MTSSKPLRLIRTKLNPPLPASIQVPRSRLGRWYQRARLVRLVLLRAPAGFGKTTFMLQWRAHAEQEGRTPVWLTLDSGENDPVRFLSYLAGAFQRIDPAVELDFSAASSPLEAALPSALLSNLLEWVSSIETPFTLFLDEFEVVQNPEVHHLLRQFLDGLPPSGQIVLSTREDPELPLARMRAREQVVEIGAEELRFDLEEAECFLRQGGNPPLGREDIAHLQRCTEGWAAGLQLARLALADRRDSRALVRSFSGTFAEISDYLLEEVLARQPEKVRDFLLKTSILERLSAPLCDAVAGSTDGHEMLAHLERSNLFVTPLDSERRWYRYHNLFAQFLKSRLNRGLDERTAALHTAAADWFEAKGGYGEAAEHALSAGLPERAAGLLARWARTLVNLGQMDTILRWVERLPKGTVEMQPELWVAHCWALVFRRHDYEEARASIARLCATCAKIRDPALQDEALALQGVVSNFEERTEEAQRVCAENLPKISNRRSFAFEILSDALGACLIWAGRFEEAERCLSSVRESHGETEDGIQTVYCDSTLGLLRLTQGRLREALSLYRAAHSRAETLHAHSLPRAVTAAALAGALLEVDEVDEAEALLAENLPVIREHRPLDLAAASYRNLSRIYLLRGREAEAERLLDEADRLARSAGSLCLTAVVRLARARLALRGGDVARAERETAALADSGSWRAVRSRVTPLCEPDTLEVLRLRSMIARGQAGQALSDLRPLLTEARSGGRLRLALSLRILEAEALEASQQRRPALRAMKEAVQQGCREGFIRTFADEGSSVLRLLQELRQASPDEEDTPEVAAAYLDRILVAAGSTPRQAPDHPPPPAAVLTDRELEVLRLLSRGLSRQEAAERLFVSLATVKYHLGNLMAKLDAGNRREALAKARRLGLLGE